MVGSCNDIDFIDNIGFWGMFLFGDYYIVFVDFVLEVVCYIMIMVVVGFCGDFDEFFIR